MDVIIQEMANYTDVSISESDENLIEYGLGAIHISRCVLSASLVVMSAATMMTLQKWRNNIRNQLLMQLIIAHFVHRLLNALIFHLPTTIPGILNTLSVYVAVVIRMLLIFFIVHMYQSVIIVAVPMNRRDLYKMMAFSWLIPIPVVVVYTVLVVKGRVDCWTFHMVMCVALRWPVLIAGTFLYLKVLYKVLRDQSRHYAMDLTIITLLIWLVINVYAISDDVKELCSEVFWVFSAVLGLVLDLLYVLLFVVMLFKARNKDIAPEGIESGLYGNKLADSDNDTFVPTKS